jgi:outer membrane protein TolC
VAGYAYQTGNKIYPEQNPFIGANFKWNLQDIFSNRQLVNQRRSQLLQAHEQVTLTEKQVTSDIEKARRKLSHARALIEVALKTVTYRTEELKIQQNKAENGLNTLSDILNTKALLAKSEAGLLAAQLNYRIVYSELMTLLGK